MKERMKGHCLCKGVTFEGELKNGAVYGACHCSMCQHWNGGPGLATEMVALTFEGEPSLAWYSSSDWAERGFCSNCGSNLFYRLKSIPDVHFVMVGTLDAPDQLHLEEHIFIDEKPAHYDFSGDAPRLTGAEFLARLQDTQP